MTEREVLINEKPMPKPKYYIEINEHISEHHTIPCKSTVICACYDKATAEWIKSLIIKAHPEYAYGRERGETEILIWNDPFYLSDDYRDVKRVKEYHTDKKTNMDLSYLSTIF